MLDVLKTVAAEIGRSPARTALAWAPARPGAASTLVGASDVSQLESNIGAAGIALSDDQTARLDEAGAPPPGFGASLTQPTIRRMIFGGHGVKGWGEWRTGRRSRPRPAPAPHRRFALSPKPSIVLETSDAAAQTPGEPTWQEPPGATAPSHRI